MSDVLVALVFVLVGSVAIVTGVAMLSTPAAFMVSGLLCVLVGVWPLMRGRFLR